MHATSSPNTSGDSRRALQPTQAGDRPKAGRFWRDYNEALAKQGVKEAVRRWYVVHVERYIKEANGKKLATHRPDDVRGYLEGCGRNPRLADWQLGQVADAIRILFADVIAVTWSAEVDWAQWIDGSRSLPPSHPTVARDYDEGRTVAAVRGRHYSIRTEQAYVGWVERFVRFHRGRKAEEMGSAEVKQFLEDLVVRSKVLASTQNQALSALVLLYDQVLERPIGALGAFARSKRPRRLPVVLSRAEVTRLLDGLEGTSQLMAGLLYGSGLRLMECVRLPVQDVDFDYHPLVVRLPT